MIARIVDRLSFSPQAHCFSLFEDVPFPLPLGSGTGRLFSLFRAHYPSSPENCGCFLNEALFSACSTLFPPPDAGFLDPGFFPFFSSWSPSLFAGSAGGLQHLLPVSKEPFHSSPEEPFFEPPLFSLG